MRSHLYRIFTYIVVFILTGYTIYATQPLFIDYILGKKSKEHFENLDFDQLMQKFQINNETLQLLAPPPEEPQDEPDLQQQETPVGNPVSYIMTDNVKNEFQNLEDVKCKFVRETIPESADGYDIINNYVLVHNPLSTRECYLKSSHSLVSGKCSKKNKNLYNTKFANIVQDVYPAVWKDDYVSKTLPQNVCMLKFKNNVDKEGLKSYLSHLDDSLPKLKGYRADIVTNLKAIKDLINEKLKLQKAIEDQVLEIASKNKSKEDYASSISNINNKVSQQENLKREWEEKFRQRKIKYDERLNSYISLCEHKDFVNCKPFRIGRYNVWQMRDMGIKNDTISSFKIPKGLSAKLFLDTLDRNDNIVDVVNNKHIEKQGVYDQPWAADEVWNDGTKTPTPQDNISSVIVTPLPLEDN